jgi:hypothetical protein
MGATSGSNSPGREDIADYSDHSSRTLDTGAARPAARRAGRFARGCRIRRLAKPAMLSFRLARTRSPFDCVLPSATVEKTSIETQNTRQTAPDDVFGSPFTWGRGGAAFRKKTALWDRASPRLQPESFGKTGHIQGTSIDTIPREDETPAEAGRSRDFGEEGRRGGCPGLPGKMKPP